jgi:site-specific recombinase XerD
MMDWLGERAGMPFLIHPHMLRHGCGFKYANEGKDTRSLQAYLGHRSIQSTVRYTAMAPTLGGAGSQERSIQESGTSARAVNYG